MQGEATSKGYGLVFGDSTFSTMVMCMFSANDEEAGKKIKDAIFSITYDKNFKVDPFASANFTLDDKVSKFKFSTSSANMFMYTIGGAKNGEGDPIVLVMPLPSDSKIAPASYSDEMISSFENSGLTDKEIKNRSTKEVNGYKACETELYGNMKGKKSLIYHLIVVKDDKMLIIQGIANSDFEKNLFEFQKFSHTIKFK
jgi:hypothetical protein